jgi:ribonuclease P protein component
LLTNNQFVRAKRLSCSEDFKQTFRQGIKLRQAYFMTYTKRNGLGYARLGLAIPKKVVPNAASRNWVKRTIRESFRLNQKLLPDLDIVVKVTSQKLSNKQLFRCDLDKQWSSLLTFYKKA